MPVERARTVGKTLATALIGNLFSAFLKLLFGILANSIAMLADAFHSMFDAGSSVIGLYGSRMSSKPPDAEHPYGHRKFEYIAALAITTMMFVTAFNVIREALARMAGDIHLELTVLSFVSMGTAATISLVVSLNERSVGKRIASPLLIADSYHSLTDVLASIVVLVGLTGFLLGFGYADSAAAIVVALLISHVAISLFRRTASALADQGIPPALLRRIQALTQDEARGISCHAIRGRIVGEKIYVDMHVTVKGDLPVKKAHDISLELESRLKAEIPGMEEVIIHIEPAETERPR